MPITPIYFANYGVYAKKYDSINALPNGATVAIANDISNIDRSLQLLAQHGVIKLSRMYDDADAVVMTPAYAAPLGLTPKSDALLTEGVENEFAITLVAREDNKNDEKIKKLAAAMTSPEVKQFLEENYAETAIPAFE